MDDEELWLEEEEKASASAYFRARGDRPKHLQDPWDAGYVGAVNVVRLGAKIGAVILYAIWPRK